jgi:hypothetical protein
MMMSVEQLAQRLVGQTKVLGENLPQYHIPHDPDHHGGNLPQYHISHMTQTTMVGTCPSTTSHMPQTTMQVADIK